MGVIFYEKGSVPVYGGHDSLRIFQSRGGAAASDWWDIALSGAAWIAVYDARAATYAASKINLVNPGTYDCTEPGGAVAWDGTNWNFVAGDGKYLECTGLDALPSYSAIVKFSGVPAVAGPFTLFGDAWFYIYPQGWGSVTYRNGTVSQVGKVPAMTSGTLAVTPVAGYRNGAFDIALITDNNNSIASSCIGSRNGGTNTNPIA